MAPRLGHLETDALTELINIGVGRAASGLRDMVGEQVLLSVPQIELLSRGEAVGLLRRREPGTLVGVHQTFKGEVSGTAVLIFPNEQSLDLVRAVTGDNLPVEELVAFEAEAMSEIGNIVLNGCLSTLANNIQQTFRMSLPAVTRGEVGEIFQIAQPSARDEAVLFLYVDFTLAKRNIRGYVTILMDVGSLMALKHLLSVFVERSTH